MWARLLWVFALVGLIFWWLKNRRSLSNLQRDGHARNSTKSESKRAPHATVACAQCGLIVPVAEALTLPGLWTKVVSRERLYFCCHDHVEQYQQSPKNSNKG